MVYGTVTKEFEAGEGAESFSTLFAALHELRFPSRGCRVLAFSSLQDHLHYFLVGVAFVRGDRSRVHVESDPGVGVTEEFLSGLAVNSCRSQVGCERVTEVSGLDVCFPVLCDLHEG